MSLQYFEEKICFYQIVFLSLYLKNIACDVGLTLEKINLDKITTSNPIFIGTTLTVSWPLLW